MRKEVKKGGQNKNELIDSKLKNIASAHKLDELKVKNRTVAIIDTNVLLSNIKSLEKNFSPGTKKITFVIPWVVIQELDNCKRKSYTKSINIRAQQAIKYIHSLLSAKADNFIFENSMQNSQDSEMIKCSSNDDQILKCALRYHTSRKLFNTCRFIQC
jgi:predicted ribonuclease YlaK